MSRSRHQPPVPRRGEVGSPAVLGEALAAAAKLAGIDVDGGRDAGAGDLGEEPGDVLPPGGVAGAAGPVAVEDHVVADTGLVVLLEPARHVGADAVGHAEDQRVDLGVEGVGLGRDEHPRSGGAHLVLVEKDLREPAVVEHVVDDLGFLLGQGVEIAVVVVADIVVVEPRHLAALVLGAEPLVVPVDDHDLAVGVDGRHEQKHRLVHPRQPLGVLGGGELIDELGGHLGRADLGGVDGAAHERHRRGRPR